MKHFGKFTSMVGLIVPALLLFFSLTSFASDRRPPVTANSTNRLEITGMTCDGCAKGVASELRRVPGVISAAVTFSNKLAVVSMDTNYVSVPKLVETIEEAGYKAKPKP